MRKPVAIAMPGNNIITRQLDQTSDASVAAAAAQVPVLDGLFLNAAAGEDGRLLDGPAAPARLAAYLDFNVVGPKRGGRRAAPGAGHAPRRAALVVGGLRRRPGRRDVRPPGPVRRHPGRRQHDGRAVAQRAATHAGAAGDEHGFVVVSVHPGWVDTEMGRLVECGGMSAADSAAALIRLEQGLREDSAHFFDWQGRHMDW